MRRLGLGAALSALLLALLAAPAGATPSPFPDDATRQRFVAGATSMGIAPEVIRMALTDPRLAAAIPVRGETTVSAVAGPAALRCRNTSVLRMTGYNWRGAWLYRMWYSQYFCWDGRLVTSWRGGTQGVGWQIPRHAKVAGWRWSGVVAHHNFKYMLGGRHGGGVDTMRVGQFDFCPIRVGCLDNQQLSIRIWLHYNGTADHRCGPWGCSVLPAGSSGRRGL